MADETPKKADAPKKADSSGIVEGEVTNAPVVQSTTEATPSPADETPMPNHLNTEHEQPPVRTSQPATAIAQTLAAGAGEHTPPDPDAYDREGRPKADGDSEAKAK